MLKQKLFLLTMLFVLLGIAMLPNTRAATLNSNWMTITPTINGTIASGEWDDAWSTTFYAHDSAHATNLGILFWAKNNATYLLLRIQWVDDTLNAELDNLLILFDETNSGNWSNPGTGVNNVFGCAINSTYLEWYDEYVTGSAWAPDVSTKDGQVAKTFSFNTYVLEIAIPLARADAEDMQPGAGALIGIAFIIDSAGQNIYCYPTDTDIHSYAATFQLASAPSSVGTPTIIITLISTIFLIALFETRQRLPKIPL